MAELGAHHDWDLADGHFVLHEDTLRRFDRLLARQRILLSLYYLQNLHVAKYFSLVGQITNPSRVGHDRLVSAVTFVQPRELIHRRLAKYDLESGLFIIRSKVLASLFNRLLSELINDFLDREYQESLE